MAYYNHLPIWKGAMSLAVLLEDAVRLGHISALLPFEPASVTSYAGLKRWFLRRLQGFVVLVQKGREYGVLGPIHDPVVGGASAQIYALIAAKTDPIAVLADHLSRYQAELRQAGRLLVVVTENGYLRRCIKRRVLYEIPGPPAPLPHQNSQHNLHRIRAMRRNLFAPLPGLAMFLMLTLGMPAHSACTAANPNANVMESTPNIDLTDNGDGTVTHSKTELMWKKCSEGQSGAECATGSASPMTWAAALTASVNANAAYFAGYRDWRLPNIKELQSIVESCGYQPSINLTKFPATMNGVYFSASSVVGFPDRAWEVDFSDGPTSFVTKGIFSNYFVRLVRGGQSVDSFDSLSTPTTSTAPDCLFNWAERTYPQFFAPAGAASATSTPYYYRYYSGKGNYLATSSADNHIWVVGASFGNSLLDVGPVTSFLGMSGCQ